jgi:hypothetical protein
MLGLPGTVRSGDDLVAPGTENGAEKGKPRPFSPNRDEDGPSTGAAASDSDRLKTPRLDAAALKNESPLSSPIVSLGIEIC